ncbi:MAG: glycosyltransferase [Lachnospiraceae bacterium]|nr:glycosyltransferase [Lachnospiraceae bacterium]
MKILITTDCNKNNVCGVTAVVIALSKGLRGLGHEVKILSLSDNHKSFKDGDACFIRSIPAFYYPDMRMSLSMHDPLLMELTDWAPDIIHSQSEGTTFIMALRIRKQCNIPLVMTCHTDYAYFAFGKFRSLPPVKVLMSTVGKKVYSHAVKVTVPSYKATDFPLLHGLRDQLTVIPNGVELEKYRKHLSSDERHKFRTAMGIDDDTKALVTVARLSKEKNIREIIEFLPDLKKVCPNVKYIIVGDGPDREHLEKLTETLGLSGTVIFTGQIPSDDVWRYYASGDLFVSASTFEVHSISYLEALVNGLPLLCREDEALRGVLEHEKNGLIYRSKEEFCEFAKKILNNDELRKDMSRCSIRIAEGFSSEAFSVSMLNLYEDAIRKYKEAQDDHP